MENIGTRIKQKRKEKGLTQAELAKEIGKTESSIRKYEKGIVDIPTTVLAEIAVSLDASIQYLIGSDKLTLGKLEFFLYLFEMCGYKIDWKTLDARNTIEHNGEETYITDNEVRFIIDSVMDYTKYMLNKETTI